MKISKNKDIKFSIVIPVYNTEIYIEECVNSILCEDYSNFEIILVDDGSSDNSLEKCYEVSKKNSKIKVVTQKHKGLSAARNNGIRNSTGEYILFLDSDDYIEKYSLKELTAFINKLNDPDIILLEAVKIYLDGEEEQLDPMLNTIKNLKNEDVLEKISAMSKFPASACTKAFRREFLSSEKQSFDETIIAGEDIDFMIKAMIKAKKINYFDRKYYYYRQNRKGSITNKVTLEKSNSFFSIIDKFCNKEKELIESNKDFVYSVIAYQYAILLAQINFLSKSDKSKLKYNYKDYKWVLKYGKSKKIKGIYYISKVIGITLTSKLLYGYLAFRNKLHKGA